MKIGILQAIIESNLAYEYGEWYISSELNYWAREIWGEQQ